MSADGTLFVLTKEYSDKSGFHVCGVTDNPQLAAAWQIAGSDPETRVYKVQLNLVTDSYDRL